MYQPKIYITAILSILFSFFSLAQKPLSIANETKLDDFPNKIHTTVINELGEIVIAGEAYRQSGKNKDFFFAKINKNGDFTNMRSFGGYEADRAYSILPLGNKKYILAGETASKWKNSKGKVDGWITCIKEGEDPLWDLIIGGENDDAVLKLMFTSDKNILALGHNDKKYYLAILSQEGELLDQNNIRVEKCEIRDAVLTPKNELIFISYAKGVNKISKCDLSGNIIWEKEFEKAVTEINDVFWDSNQCLVAGVIRDRTYREQGYIAVVDTEGNISSESSVGMQWRDGAEKVLRLINGDVLLVGQSYSHQRNARKPKVWIDVLDSELNEIKESQQFVGTKDADIVTELSQSYSGKIIITAWTQGLIGTRGMVIDLQEPIKSQSNIDAKISSFTFESKIENEIQSQEEVILNVDISNNSSEEFYGGVLANKNEKLKGIELPEDVLLPAIPPGKKHSVQIPIVAELIEANQQLILKYELYANQSKIDEIDIEVLLREEQKSSLKLSTYDITQNKDDITKYALTFEILNEGNIASESANLRVFVPPFVEILSNEKINLNGIENGVTKQIQIDFQVNNNYYSEDLDFEILGLDQKDQTILTGFKKINLFNEFGPLPEKEDIAAVPLAKANERGKLKANKKQDDVELPEIKISDVKPKEILNKEEDVVKLEESSEKDSKEPETKKADDTNEIAKEEKPVPEVEEVVNIFWNYPDIDELGTEIPHLHHSIPIKIKMITNKDISEEDIILFINGKEAKKDLQFDPKNQDLIKTPNNSGGFRYTYKNKINLIIGDNKIALKIGPNFETISEEINVSYNPKKPNLFIYSIGIPYQDLKYSSKDAKDFADQFIRQKGQLYNDVTIKTYNDLGKTSKAELVKSMEDIRNDFFHKDIIADDDVIMVYFSGHGFQADDRYKSFRIAASDFDPYYTNSYSVDFEREVVEVLRDVRAKKIFFLDACYSGAAVDILDEGSKSLDLGLENEIALSKAIEDVANTEGDFTFVLSSSMGERSYEDESWDNSAFTKAIIEAFNNVKVETDAFDFVADLDENGVLYLNELYEFLKIRVPQLVSSKKPKTKTSQTPFIPDTHLETDKPIFIVE